MRSADATWMCGCESLSSAVAISTDGSPTSRSRLAGGGSWTGSGKAMSASASDARARGSACGRGEGDDARPDVDPPEGLPLGGVERDAGELLALPPCEGGTRLVTPPRRPEDWPGEGVCNWRAASATAEPGCMYMVAMLVTRTRVVRVRAERHVTGCAWMANGMSQSDHHAGAPAASKTRKFTQSSKTKLMFSKIFVTLTRCSTSRVLTLKSQPRTGRGC